MSEGEDLELEFPRFRGRFYAKTVEHGMVRFVIALPGDTGKLRFGILDAIEKL